MSTIPSTIPDLGNSALLPTPYSGFDPAQHAAQLSGEDYFVFTRIDGQATLRQIILETGFDVERAVGILRKLRRLGAFLLPGETEPPAASPDASPDRPGEASSKTRAPVGSTGAANSPRSDSARSNRGSGAASAATAEPTAPSDEPKAGGPENAPRAVPAMGTVRLDKPMARPAPPGQESAERPRARGTDGREASEPSPGTLLEQLDLSEDERKALEEEVVLTPAQKASLLALRRHVASEDYFALLDVEPDIGKRELKRAYFRISKRFHPDRFYGKELGSWAPWLTEIFEAASRAFDILSDERRRREYVARRNGVSRGQLAVSPQSREEHASDLFEQACALEVRGDHTGALRLFAAVVRINPLPRFLQRAARCSLAAGQLVSAEEYAKKAAELRPNDPSCGRLLASVMSAAGQLAEAESTLVHSLSLITENDVLVGELQSDLADVRRRIALGAVDQSGDQD